MSATASQPRRRIPSAAPCPVPPLIHLAPGGAVA